MVLIYCALVLGAYFLGAIPFGLIVGKLWKGMDIRTVGSGNIGATNTLRALGPVPAAIVFAVDILKGFFPVYLGRSVFHVPPAVAVAIALIAVIGHTYSAFIGFKGGKGAATSLGVIIGLSPLVALIDFGIWLLVVVTTRYVSLGAIVAAASVPVLMFLVTRSPAYTIFGLVAASFVIAKHRSNIVRLRNGTERKFGEKA